MTVYKESVQRCWNTDILYQFDFYEGGPKSPIDASQKPHSENNLYNSIFISLSVTNSF